MDCCTCLKLVGRLLKLEYSTLPLLSSQYKELPQTINQTSDNIDLGNGFSLVEVGKKIEEMTCTYDFYVGTGTFVT